MRRGLAVMLGVILLAVLLALPAVVPAPPAPGGGQTAPAVTGAPGATAAPTATQAPARVEEAAAHVLPYRAVWVSYLEWQEVDFSSADAFTADIAPMLDNMAALGANVVLAQVRPFGDALYPSAYYPFSHLCTGTQGQDPGFDPLALLITAAAARGLEVEAWVNPYRLQAGGTPAVLDAQSPANLHPDWVKSTDSGLFLDPANPEVRQYIADAVGELCANYAIAGVHFDDYFYPTTAEDFDADEYAAYQSAAGAPLPLADWRRQNVDALITLCWQTVHGFDGLRFGVAPQGDIALNYDAQYSDAALWLAEGGYVDYLCPQLYWGLDYTKDGSGSHALGALSAAWAALPRAEGVHLYFGLGAYRIGEGDGGDLTGPGTEWQRGDALAGQLAALRALPGGCEGLALYRYANLFANALYPTLAGQETDALKTAW